MKKLFAVLLTLAILLGLAACGNSGDSAKLTIVGTWKGSIDMGAVLETALQMEIDEPLSCDVIYTYKEDGTASISVDEDSFADMMEALTDVVIGMMGEMFGEEFDFEAMLEAEGMTEEEFREQIMASVNVEEMLGDMGAEKGYYKYEDGKLYTAAAKEDLENLEELPCIHVTLKSNTLTFTDIEQDGESAAEIMPGLFPLVFTKQ
jgi:hypothetical protein